MSCNAKAGAKAWAKAGAKIEANVKAKAESKAKVKLIGNARSKVFLKLHFCAKTRPK